MLVEFGNATERKIIAVNACVVDLLNLHPNCFSSNDGCSEIDRSYRPIKDSGCLATA